MIKKGLTMIGYCVSNGIFLRVVYLTQLQDRKKKSIKIRGISLIATYLIRAVMARFVISLVPRAAGSARAGAIGSSSR